MHIQKFVDRVRACESRGQRDLVLSINDAKDLHADITRLLLELQNLQLQKVIQPNEEIIAVEIHGGGFK